MLEHDAGAYLGLDEQSPGSFQLGCKHVALLIGLAFLSQRDGHLITQTNQFRLQRGMVFALDLVERRVRPSW